MRILVTILVFGLLMPTIASAGADEHEMFKQICALLELNDVEKKKLAVAFITLEENLDAATAGVGHEDFDPADLIDAFHTTRVTFRDSVSTFLSPDKFDLMMRYSSAILYELADDVARVRVMKFKDSLKLTEDQITALTLVVNEDLRSIVESCLMYSDKDYDDAVADVMREDVQDIRENSLAQIKKILSEDQWTTLQKMSG